MRPPSVEVRFKDLYVETQVYADLSRNLPSVIGFYRESIEVGVHSLGKSTCSCNTRSSALTHAICGCSGSCRSCTFCGQTSASLSSWIK